MVVPLIGLAEAVGEAAAEPAAEAAAEAVGEAADVIVYKKSSIPLAALRRRWALEAMQNTGDDRVAQLRAVIMGTMSEESAHDVVAAVDATLGEPRILRRGLAAIDEGGLIPTEIGSIARRVITNVSKLGPDSSIEETRQLANRVWGEVRLYGDTPPPREVRLARAITRRLARGDTEGITTVERKNAQRIWSKWKRDRAVERQGGLALPRLRW